MSSGLIVLLINSVRMTSRIILWAITLDIILSWVYPRSNPLSRVLHTITEPILRPFRNMLRNSALGGPGLRLDFSPLLAMLFLQILESVIITFLYSLL